MPVAPWVVSTPQRIDADVTFSPILDLARGVVAGYQTVASPVLARRSQDVVDDPCSIMTAALAAAATLPADTFLTVPLGLGDGGPGDLEDRTLMSVLEARGDLSGVVLDLRDVPEDVGAAPAARLESLRAAGATVALGGEEAAQPTLRSIIRLRPSIVRLGRAWVEGVEHSAEKRDAIEVTGTMAAQLDAWLLAEGVRTAAELRTLSELGVPLAQGPLVGRARRVWQDAAPQAHRALPRDRAPTGDGVLRDLLRRAYTTDDVGSARSVLAETVGFEVVVAVDEHRRPHAVLVKDDHGRWQSGDVLAVHVDTPVGDAVARAMARPRSSRFGPLACTDSAGGFLGVLHLEDLMTHLVGSA